MTIKPSIRHIFAVLAILVLMLAACSAQPAAEDNALNNPAPGNQDNANPPAEDSSNNAQKEAQPEPTAEPAPTDPPTEEPAPTEDTSASVQATVSYSADIEPILVSRCLTCHGGDRIENGLVMFTYQDLMAGGESGPVIIPGDAANSYLVELVETLKMPKRGPKLTPVQIQLIIDWVNEGAQNN